MSFKVGDAFTFAEELWVGGQNLGGANVLAGVEVMRGDNGDGVYIVLNTFETSFGLGVSYPLPFPPIAPSIICMATK